MKKNLKLITMMAQAYLQASANYRLEAIMWIIRGFIVPLILMSVWLAANQYNGEVSWTNNQIITYYFLTIIIIRLTQTWIGYSLGEVIKEGSLSNFLVKPLSYLIPELARDMGHKILRFITLSPFIIFMIVLIGNRIELKLAPSNLFAALVAIVLGYCLNFIMSTTVCLLAFWLKHTGGAYTIYQLFGDLFTGSLLPLTLLPGNLSALAYILPFKYFIAVPIRALVEDVSLVEVLRNSGVSLMWLIFFLLINSQIYKHGLKKYSATGI